jgi:hypothetical protein
MTGSTRVALRASTRHAAIETTVRRIVIAATDVLLGQHHQVRFQLQLEIAIEVARSKERAKACAIRFRAASVVIFVHQGPAGVR